MHDVREENYEPQPGVQGGDMDPDWACAVRTKSRNVYDVGQGQGPDDDQANYHESEPLQLDHNHHYDPHEEDIDYVRTDLPPIEAYVIS
jgi:hypothetical protein